MKFISSMVPCVRIFKTAVAAVAGAQGSKPQNKTEGKSVYIHTNEAVKKIT